VHFASFDLGDPLFEVEGLRLSAQLVTLENLYGLDPARTRVGRGRGGALEVCAAGLRCAGGQERAEGEVRLRALPEGPGRLRLRLSARAPGRIRCTKLLLRDLAPPLAVVDPGGAAREVGAAGELRSYPGLLRAPLFLIRAGGERLGARAEDPRVREKRFAVSLERVGGLAGRGVLELVHEEDASRFGPSLETPPFVVERGATWDGLEAAHAAFAERELGLVPLAERADLPGWARALRLVVTLHGMHWTGRVFLDYRAMLETLRFVCERIEPGRVLAYLPGWEGRYYWRYGEYRPEPRLGGEAGFARLCEGARALGCHLMPMFGGNCANAWLPGLGDLEPSAHLKSATGNRFHGNQPDWDLSRAHDTGWQAWLNPGHPGWRERLAAQIEALALRYRFDGVFLDTIHVWTNDPDHPVFDGVRALAQRLREHIPGVLLAAEHDYDGLLTLFPLFQRAWWSAPPAWTARYALRFAHLCEGEPEGRTGVHEFGRWRPGAVPGAPGLLATIAFQDDTLARSRAAVEAAIAAAAAEA
jgi:hypothetical protein